MFCAISGSVPEEPVVSRKSGHLFEKRLILKAIKDTGLCPITGEAIGEDDLLELKANKAVKPRPSPATSIPGLLGLFHNEWDALMLETHSLRQSLHTVRQELSHALYQHDAACRVIARLVRERDEARAALETATAAGVAPAGGEMANGKRAIDVEMEEAPAKRPKAGITSDVVEVMTKTSLELSKGRKKRAISPSLASPEEIDGYSLLAKQPLHKTSGGGILALDVSPSDDNVVASAGGDGNVVVFDRAAGRILSTLSGHAKKVKDVKFLGRGGDALLSCGVDKTTRLWRPEGDDGGFKCVATYADHASEVNAVTVHPSGQYWVTASADKTWCFYDQDMCLAQVSDPAVEAGYTCAAFHPDGLILGTGTEDAAVRIWEVRQQKNVAKFEGHSGPVTCISFSENGYYLATCAADGVKLWDLRKLRNFKSLTPYESSPTTSVAFDNSGLYLAAAGGPDARVYGVKQDWGVVKTFADVPKKGAYAVKFCADAKALLVGAADHNLRIFGPKQ